MNLILNEYDENDDLQYIVREMVMAFLERASIKC